MEIWKTIPNYEDYQVSNLGNVKSLKWYKGTSERIIVSSKSSNGYLLVKLCENKKCKTFSVHQLVAVAFLGHTPDGTNKIVIDHINGNKMDNRVENLQLITNRENGTKDRKGYSSKHAGVGWDKDASRWRARIQYKGRLIYLGLFEDETEAKEIYQKALFQLKIGEDLNSLYPKYKNKSSQYAGVHFDKKRQKWCARKKDKYIGRYNSEIEAFEACLNYQI